MKDVIFQGTRDRKPSGMAEVVLHLIRDEEFFDPEDQELEDIDATLSELDDHLVDLDEIVPEDEAESETAEAVGETGAADAIAETPSDSLVETNGFHDQEGVDTETFLRSVYSYILPFAAWSDCFTHNPDTQ